MDYINILLVEDEKNISDVIKVYLAKEKYNVFFADDGEMALDLFNTNHIHLIILDLMIPKISGEEVCKKIRSISDVPIIMLTAKTHEDDRIEGLSIGADDYVLKPFSPRELISRVKALLRRSYPNSRPSAEKLSFNNGDLEIEVDKMIVRKNKESITLTTNEFKILLALVSNSNHVLSREQLIEFSLGHEYNGFDRTIDTYIKNIRQKIESNPKSPEYIHTVYGTGYKFGIDK
ncbi:response regulator transcription factor [Tissierella sp.]|uniref:response regulator transcription factor n=1 Tax=Tissierella sp. TaxID=41274 RepID=UPI00285A21E1|nr:response regulator transcription factor [Tissierella sp.]MDR7856537.1 response regulator transcription factor [Tissierella sp.]